MKRVEVNVIGTPLKYWIDDNLVSLLHTEGDNSFCPGERVHTCIGDLLVEEIWLGEDNQPLKVVCSVPRRTRV
jgi:hypothetical protein